MIDDVLAPAPRRAPTTRDWWLVGVLALGAAAELVAAEESQLVFALTALAAIAVLPFRRGYGMWCTLLAFGVILIVDLIDLARSIPGDVTFAGSVARIVVVYAVIRWEDGMRRAIGFAMFLVATVVIPLIESDLVDVLLTVLFVAVVAMSAQAMRYRERLLVERTAAGRLAERNDLARELHDSVAHHVSAIAVQAQAGQFVAATDPAKAQTVLADIEQIANQTLDEMRRLVGILRSDEDARRGVAAASLRELEAVPATPPVTLVGQTDLSSFPRAVGAALFRIAQESTTNARRHAPGVSRIEIDLQTIDGQVVLHVRNDGQVAQRRADGFGLTGMRERVAALGGTFAAGPAERVGWTVSVTLPLADVVR